MTHDSPCQKEQARHETVLRSWASDKPVPVFNVCDLGGEARLSEARMAQVEAPRTIEVIEAAEQNVGGWPVPVSWGGERPCYSPAADRIALPERSAFHSSEAAWPKPVSRHCGGSARN